MTLYLTEVHGSQCTLKIEAWAETNASKYPDRILLTPLIYYDENKTPIEFLWALITNSEREHLSSSTSIHGYTSTYPNQFIMDSVCMNFSHVHRSAYTGFL